MKAPGGKEVKMYYRCQQKKNKRRNCYGSRIGALIDLADASCHYASWWQDRFLSGL